MAQESNTSRDSLGIQYLVPVPEQIPATREALLLSVLSICFRSPVAFRPSDHSLVGTVLLNTSSKMRRLLLGHGTGLNNRVSRYSYLPAWRTRQNKRRKVSCCAGSEKKW